MTDSLLQPNRERGGWRGFSNLLRLENERWWRTRRWWVQTLVLALAINGLLAFGLWVDTAGASELPPQFVEGAWDVALMWMSVLTVLDTLFLMPGAVVGEKQNGVTAWLLSGPVSRPAYLLSKFTAHAIGILSTGVVFQIVLAYGQLALKMRAALPVFPIVIATGLQILYVLFYLALALMLGVFFSSRVPVLAIGFGVLFSQPFLDRLASEFAPGWAWLLPAKLPELARFALRAEPFPSALPIVVGSALILTFLLIALWRFQREEF
jgi:hypothetical protein